MHSLLNGFSCKLFFIYSATFLYLARSVLLFSWYFDCNNAPTLFTLVLKYSRLEKECIYVMSQFIVNDPFF